MTDIKYSTLGGMVGQTLGTSEWTEIDQDTVNQFAAGTADHQWIHVDVERATRDSPFKAPIAHGFLTLSLLSHLLGKSIEISGSRMGVNYGLNRVRFTDPVRVNSRLRARFVLHDVVAIKGGIQMVWKVTVECEGSDKPVLVAEWLGRRYG